ncbi:recombinase family protein [Streptomyces sp. NBC_01304]|uniref:recombinase family protein n=1 Tax=Streptomyces sp. NBC_01304 TaxID=2903818 RepID=UPI002E101950|nr:recombinase family protein [Streptomyces sp. NBC_01304]
MDLGYARVSTSKQDLTRQIDALNAEGIGDGQIWVDKKTGATVQRDGLAGVLAYARPGDTVVAHTLDRLGRNIRECLNLIHDLRERDISVRTLADPIRIDTRDTSGTGEIAVLMLALFAQMERVFTRERAAHARSVAAKTGRRPGRPRKMTDDQVRRAKAALDSGDSLAAVAADYGVDRSTLYRRVEDLRGPEELRCRACGAVILAPEVPCPNCGDDDPAPVARSAYDEAHAEDPPEPDDHGGLARIGRPTIAPGSLADHQR